MINIKLFLKEREILFDSDKQMISWVKRNLKLANIVKLGPNYMSDEKDIEKALKTYITNQKEIKEKKIILAKKLAAKRKRAKDN